MSEMVLQNFNTYSFQQDLLNWYYENKRDLPWRKDQDPYKIWVSEIMLQQTKVDTVIPYFNRFMTKFPTVYDLAKADPQDVLKEWEGLGYYSRARNLQHAVREVIATYEGVIPGDPEKLGSLKGIGPYTRGAILSIAFDQPEPAVDGNVMRVISRILKIEENTSEQRIKRLFESYIRKLISTEDPSSFNQGLMELGALICTPKKPMCLFCPVQSHCRAFAAGVEGDLPIRTKARGKRTITYAALIIKNSKGHFAIEQRPDKGLLADLWQFPMVPTDEVDVDQIEEWFYTEYGLKITLKRKMGELKHIFSHLVWDIDIYDVEALQNEIGSSVLKFEDEVELRKLPFPVPHLKMMKYLSDNRTPK